MHVAYLKEFVVAGMNDPSLEVMIHQNDLAETPLMVTLPKMGWIWAILVLSPHPLLALFFFLLIFILHTPVLHPLYNVSFMGLQNHQVGVLQYQPSEKHFINPTKLKGSVSLRVVSKVVGNPESKAEHVPLIWSRAEWFHAWSEGHAV